LSEAQGIGVGDGVADLVDTERGGFDFGRAAQVGGLWGGFGWGSWQRGGSAGVSILPMALTRSAPMSPIQRKPRTAEGWEATRVGSGVMVAEALRCGLSRWV
jgi:hypothetical protein